MNNLIAKYTIQLAEPACRVGSARFGALVDLLDGISAVFPYLNAIEEKARYDHENQVLHFEVRRDVIPEQVDIIVIDADGRRDKTSRDNLSAWIFYR